MKGKKSANAGISRSHHSELPTDPERRVCLNEPVATPGDDLLHVASKDWFNEREGLFVVQS